MIASLQRRLALRLIWWRHAYPFSVAHKPLCSRFAHNVLRIGRARVCRSCLVLYACALITATILLSVEVSERVFLTTFYVFFVPVLSLSHPRPYRHLSRLMRDGIRGATGGVIVMMIAFFAYGPVWIGIVNLAAFAGVYATSLHAYKAQKHHACDGCPELGRDQVCSGFRRQVVLIRAYERAADRYLGYDGQAAGQQLQKERVNSLPVVELPNRWEASPSTGESR